VFRRKILRVFDELFIMCQVCMRAEERRLHHRILSGVRMYHGF
jgi:hypothetical protein